MFSTPSEEGVKWEFLASDIACAVPRLLAPQATFIDTLTSIRGACDSWKVKSRKTGVRGCFLVFVGWMNGRAIAAYRFGCETGKSSLELWATST